MGGAHAKTRQEVIGVILAGGKARRMGGVDKGLVPVNERPMITYVIDSLRPQVAEVLINANRNRDRYREFGCRVIADADREFRGPLSGIASGMRATRKPYVAFAPCDSPLLCPDLVPRLHAALSAEGTRIAVAHDGERLQPVFALLERGLLEDLERYLEGGGRKIDQWYATHGYATADFSDRPEAFLNINSPADRRALEAELDQRIGDKADDSE
ncbi:MAG: molybdenum cofactor guanylyltransferase MobA [Gammaproteobacteria bacterium]|jgi:molybdopterin-guanine dinucleotide biosynthesis protein A